MSTGRRLAKYDHKRSMYTKRSLLGVSANMWPGKDNGIPQSSSADKKPKSTLSIDRPRINYIDVDVAKTSVKLVDSFQWSMDMSVDLRLLAQSTGMSPGGDVSVHVWPSKLICDELDGSRNSWMC